MRINTGCWVDGCKCFNPNDEDGVEIKRDKEWVGLTDKEIEDCLEMSIQGTCRAIEAKLKEKNGG
jgi:hypothetical protein